MLQIFTLTIMSIISAGVFAVLQFIVSLALLAKDAYRCSHLPGDPPCFYWPPVRGVQLFIYNYAVTFSLVMYLLRDDTKKPSLALNLLLLT